MTKVWLPIVAAAVVVTSARPGEACEAARHLHRVLLGTTPDGPVVAEIDVARYTEGIVMLRGRKGWEERMGWEGRVSLRVPAAGGAATSVRRLRPLTFQYILRPGRVRAKWDELVQRFHKAFRHTLLAALAEARRLPGFVIAPMPSSESCHHANDCGVEVRTLSEDNRFEVVVDTDSGSRSAPFELPRGFEADEASRKNAFQTGWREGQNEGMEEISARRVLTYSTPIGQIAVLDIGAPQAESEGSPMAGYDEPSDALWPPCGCSDWTDCPPVARTVEHGLYTELVIPLGGGRRQAAQPHPVPAPLTQSALQTAERAAAVRPRTDGIYAGRPICGSACNCRVRTFLRFFENGSVCSVVDRYSEDEAAAMTEACAEDEYNPYRPEWTGYEGEVQNRGRRITFLMKAARHFSGPYDGIVEGDRMVLSTDAGESETQVFVFVPD